MIKKILHVSDIHYRREYPTADSGYYSIFNKMRSPLLHLQQVLNSICLAEIGLVVVTGDLTEGGGPEDYRQLKQELKKMLGEIPFYPVLGNHDNKAAFFEGWFEEKELPYYNSVAVQGEVTLITLDNSKEGNENGKVEEVQCLWLQQALTKVETKHCFLLTHHHLLPRQSDLPPAQYPPCFEEIIKASKIDGILCGHTHCFYEGVFAGVPYFTAPSLSFVGSEVEAIEGGQRVSFVEQWGGNMYWFEKEILTCETISALEPKRFLGQVDFISSNR